MEDAITLAEKYRKWIREAPGDLSPAKLKKKTTPGKRNLADEAMEAGVGEGWFELRNVPGQGDDMTRFWPLEDDDLAPQQPCIPDFSSGP